MLGLYECHAHGRKISVWLQPIPIQTATADDGDARRRRRMTTTPDDDDEYARRRRRRPTRRRVAAERGGFKAGFLGQKASTCTAVEAPPKGGSALEKCLRENRKLSARPRDMLPDLQEGAVRVQVIGGNHTTGFCRAVNAGCKSPVKEPCNDNGRLDVAKLADQPAFVSAVVNGLTYQVISYVVELPVPGFVDFVRNARRLRRPLVVVVVVVAVVSTRRSSAL